MLAVSVDFAQLLFLSGLDFEGLFLFSYCFLDILTDQWEYTNPE